MPEVPVEVCSAMDPAGRLGVLLQLPDGYILMQPAGARELATLLTEVANEVDRHDEPETCRNRDRHSKTPSACPWCGYDPMGKP